MESEQAANQNTPKKSGEEGTGDGLEPRTAFQRCTHAAAGSIIILVQRASTIF